MIIINRIDLGWIVTFLMIVRGGGPSSGYVSTGFFGGRFLFIFVFFLYHDIEHIIFLIRSYFGPRRLSRGDQEGDTLYTIEHFPGKPNGKSVDWKHLRHLCLHPPGNFVSCSLFICSKMT